MVCNAAEGELCFAEGDYILLMRRDDTGWWQGWDEPGLADIDYVKDARYAKGWEWLLANLDSHADQYVLVGDEGLPLNVAQAYLEEH